MTLTQLLGRGESGRTRTSSSSRIFFLESGINRHQRGLRTSSLLLRPETRVWLERLRSKGRHVSWPVSRRGRGCLRVVINQEESKSIDEQSHSKTTSCSLKTLKKELIPSTNISDSLDLARGKSGKGPSSH